jgi:methionyl aminopeptidase
MRDYKFTGTMRPVYPLSEKRAIPDHIVKPDYADHRMSPSHYLADIIAQGFSQCEAVRERSVKILTKEEIEGMRKVCRVGPLVLISNEEELMYSSHGRFWT